LVKNWRKYRKSEYRFLLCPLLLFESFLLLKYTDNITEKRGVNRTTQKPGVMGGKPCNRDMWVTVGMIVGQIGKSHSVYELCRCVIFSKFWGKTRWNETDPLTKNQFRLQ